MDRETLKQLEKQTHEITCLLDDIEDTLRGAVFEDEFDKEVADEMQIMASHAYTQIARIADSVYNHLYES